MVRISPQIFSILFLALQTKGFTSLASRTSLSRLHLILRKLSYFQATAQATKLTSAARELSAELTTWRTEVRPLYVSGPGTSMHTVVREWDNKHYSVTKMNALELSVLIEQHIQTVNQTALTYFQNREQALNSPEVKFIFENSENIMHFFSQVRQAEIDGHHSFIILLRTALLCCKSSIGILAFIFSLIIPMFSYNSFQAR
jgi:hypothetical protein